MAKKSEDRFIEIDENRLDEEWVEQPTLYFKWATKLADARLKLDEKKAELDLVYAELDSEIRCKPKKYNLKIFRDAPTEGSVKACVLNQTEYIDAQADLNSAHHEVRILEAGVQALEHRKRALEKLVDLFGMNYFSEPRAKGEKSQDAKRNYEKRKARGSYRGRDEE